MWSIVVLYLAGPLETALDRWTLDSHLAFSGSQSLPGRVQGKKSWRKGYHWNNCKGIVET